MDIYLRPVEEGDAEVLFEWRTDPTTRQNSKNTQELKFESHLKWLRVSLANPDRMMFIASDQHGNRLGQIRFDRDGTTAEIGIAVAPAMRGHGIGTAILKNGCETYFQKVAVDHLLAEIKSGNSASLIMFKKAGFEVLEESDDLVRMRLRR